MHITMFVSAPRMLALAACLSAVMVQAQTDPTRPSAAWLAAQPRTAGAEAPADARTPEAQIVVLGPSRKFALVNGEPVHAGETYAGAKLVAIDADGILWHRAGAEARSTMSPAVEKTAPGKGGIREFGPNVRKKVLTGGVQ